MSRENVEIVKRIWPGDIDSTLLACHAETEAMPMVVIPRPA